MFRRIISSIICISFLITQTGFAQVATVELNLGGYFARMSSSLTPIDSFRPIHLRYFSYDQLNNSFKVLLDKGDLKEPKVLKTEELKNDVKELLNYFLIGVTLPDDTFWVNLRPDLPEQIIDEKLARTDIGKIMLETDLQLKRDTANFTSPQTEEGREYWNRLYKKAEELYGTDTVTIPTLTRPWIVPGEIIVRETKDSAYIYKANLKVLLEQDYLKDSAQYSFKDGRAKALNEYSSQLIRELIIPKLTKEVNISKRYAALRQVYYSLILSRWFKSRFASNGVIAGQSTPVIASPKGEAISNFVNLIDSQNLTNLISKDSWSKDTYFQAYKKSFAEGEYNIKEPHYTPSGQVIRSYFSGGIMGLASSPTGTATGSGKSVAVLPYMQMYRGDKNGIIAEGDATSAGSPLKGKYIAKSQRVPNVDISLLIRAIDAVRSEFSPYGHHGLSMPEMKKAIDNFLDDLSLNLSPEIITEVKKLYRVEPYEFKDAGNIIIPRSKITYMDKEIKRLRSFIDNPAAEAAAQAGTSTGSVQAQTRSEGAGSPVMSDKVINNLQRHILPYENQLLYGSQLQEIFNAAKEGLGPNEIKEMFSAFDVVPSNSLDFERSIIYQPAIIVIKPQYNDLIKSGITLGAGSPVALSTNLDQLFSQLGGLSRIVLFEQEKYQLWGYIKLGYLNGSITNPEEGVGNFTVCNQGDMRWQKPFGNLREALNYMQHHYPLTLTMLEPIIIDWEVLRNCVRALVADKPYLDLVLGKIKKVEEGKAEDTNLANFHYLGLVGLDKIAISLRNSQFSVAVEAQAGKVAGSPLKKLAGQAGSSEDLGKTVTNAFSMLEGYVYKINSRNYPVINSGPAFKFMTEFPYRVNVLREKLKLVDDAVVDTAALNKLRTEMGGDGRDWAEFSSARNNPEIVARLKFKFLQAWLNIEVPVWQKAKQERQQNDKEHYFAYSKLIDEIGSGIEQLVEAVEAGTSVPSVPAQTENKGAGSPVMNPLARPMIVLDYASDELEGLKIRRKPNVSSVREFIAYMEKSLKHLKSAPSWDTYPNESDQEVLKQIFRVELDNLDAPLTDELYAQVVDTFEDRIWDMEQQVYASLEQKRDKFRFLYGEDWLKAWSMTAKVLDQDFTYQDDAGGKRNGKLRKMDLTVSAWRDAEDFIRRQLDKRAGDLAIRFLIKSKPEFQGKNPAFLAGFSYRMKLEPVYTLVLDRLDGKAAGSPEEKGASSAVDVRGQEAVGILRNNLIKGLSEQSYSEKSTFPENLVKWVESITPPFEDHGPSFSEEDTITILKAFIFAANLMKKEDMEGDSSQYIREANNSVINYLSGMEFKGMLRLKRKERIEERALVLFKYIIANKTLFPHTWTVQRMEQVLNAISGVIQTALDISDGATPNAGSTTASSALRKDLDEQIVDLISARADSDRSTSELLEREFPGIDRETRSKLTMILKDSTRSDLPYNREVQNRLKDYLKKTSSPLVDKPVGGISFRPQDMVIKYEPMGSLQGLNFKLPTLSYNDLNQMNLEFEAKQIKQMIASGMTPSGQRIKEFLAACCQKQQLSEYQGEVAVWLVEACRLDEQQAQDSSSELKEAIVILENITA